MDAVAPPRRQGEESGELGEDGAWVFRLKKAIAKQVLARSLLDAVRPMCAHSDDLDEDELAFVIDDKRASMRAKLRVLKVNAHTRRVSKGCPLPEGHRASRPRGAISSPGAAARTRL